MLDGKTARCLYAIAFFYFSRALVQVGSFYQNLFTFKIPIGAFWEFPGFPSLMVPYGQASDFYPSGHSGFLVILIKEHLLLSSEEKEELEQKRIKFNIDFIQKTPSTILGGETPKPIEPKPRESHWQSSVIAWLLVGQLVSIITVLISFRQHYSIDIVIGLLYGYYCHFLLSKFAFKLDRFFGRLRVTCLKKFRRYSQEYRSQPECTHEIESRQP